MFFYGEFIWRATIKRKGRHITTRRHLVLKKTLHTEKKTIMNRFKYLISAKLYIGYIYRSCSTTSTISNIFKIYSSKKINHKKKNIN